MVLSGALACNEVVDVRRAQRVVGELAHVLAGEDYAPPLAVDGADVAVRSGFAESLVAEHPGKRVAILVHDGHLLLLDTISPRGLDHGVLPYLLFAGNLDSPVILIALACTTTLIAPLSRAITSS